VVNNYLIGGMPLKNNLDNEKTRAIICSLDIRTKSSKNREKAHMLLTPQESAQELTALAETLDMEVCDVIIQQRMSPDPATYLGRGKAEEIAQIAKDLGASYVLIDGQLSPTQVKNLQDITEATVLDRTEVILKIFAERATTKEGKLQVELATRRHELTRLTGYGTVLSSLGAGIGTRGPGEQKLEVDRRVVRDRISLLSKELEKAKKVREVQRKQRKESMIPHVALVGYTNAGKSTLFKALSGEQEVLCDDKLFATLDPWTRKCILPSGKLVLISDTVGFIQGLPHDLIYAFRSTLEESLDADVLIHVVDISSPIWAEQVQTVEQVLKDLGAGEVPTIYAFNKCDKVRDVNVAEIAAEYRGIPISALYGYGLEDLFMRIEKELLSKTKIVSWKIPYVMWDVLSEIREYGTILEEVYDTNGAQVTCRLAPADISRLSKKLSG